EPGKARERLTAGMYGPKGDDATGILEQAFVACVACEPIENKLRKALKKGKVVLAQGMDLAAEARAKGLITTEEHDLWTRKEALRKQVIRVDDFPQDFGRAELLESERTQPMVRAA